MSLLEPGQLRFIVDRIATLTGASARHVVAALEQDASLSYLDVWAEYRADVGTAAGTPLKLPHDIRVLLVIASAALRQYYNPKLSIRDDGELIRFARLLGELWPDNYHVEIVADYLPGDLR